MTNYTSGFLVPELRTSRCQDVCYKIKLQSSLQTWATLISVLVMGLRSFQQRHGIHHAVLSGEAAEVREETVTDWSSRLPDICKGYAKEDIFNADETGLFYRTMPSKSMVTKGSNTSNGKLAKERITVLLAASASGEKLKPLVIGKSANPRCFSQFKREQLGVFYESNRKAWMTSEIFTKWLRRVNNRMSLQSRRILLFLDNCGAHPSIELSHVKFYFFFPTRPVDCNQCMLV